jgi:hypothetical protein
LYDGCYCLDLAKTGHNIYGAASYAPAGWYPTTKNVPDNIHLIDPSTYNWRDTTPFHLLINQSPVHQDFVKKFGLGLHLPTIMVSHEALPARAIQEMNYRAIPSIVASISDNELTSVINDSVIIPRAYSDEAYAAEEKDIVLVHGHFLPEDYNLLRSLQAAIPSLVISGNNPGLSTQLYDKEHYNLFARAKIFVNLSSLNHISDSLVTAMKSGCAIVSNRTDYLSKTLKDNVRFFNSVAEAPAVVNSIKDEVPFLQKQALEYVHTHHGPIKEFVDTWNTILEKHRYEVFLA